MGTTWSLYDSIDDLVVDPSNHPPHVLVPLPVANRKVQTAEWRLTEGPISDVPDSSVERLAYAGAALAPGTDAAA